MVEAGRGEREGGWGGGHAIRGRSLRMRHSRSPHSTKPGDEAHRPFDRQRAGSVKRNHRNYIRVDSVAGVTRFSNANGLHKQNEHEQVVAAGVLL